MADDNAPVLVHRYVRTRGRPVATCGQRSARPLTKDPRAVTCPDCLEVSWSPTVEPSRPRDVRLVFDDVEVPVELTFVGYDEQEIADWTIIMPEDWSHAGPPSSVLIGTFPPRTSIRFPMLRGMTLTRVIDATEPPAGEPDHG